MQLLDVNASAYALQKKQKLVEVAGALSHVSAAMHTHDDQLPFPMTELNSATTSTSLLRSPTSH